MNQNLKTFAQRMFVFRAFVHKVIFMKQLTGKSGELDKGFLARHFPRAHAYFDNKKRFGALLDAIEQGQKIGRHGLSATHGIMDFETSQNPRRGQIASLITEALDGCKQQPDIHDFLMREAKKLEDKIDPASSFVAALLYSAASTYSTTPLETYDKFRKASELYIRAACFDEATIIGFYAVPYIRNADDSVPADRDSRLEKIASTVAKAVRLKVAEYETLELSINLRLETVQVFNFLRALDPRFADLRDLAIAAFQHHLANLG
ncbi:Uncharacterised protein [Candidatus Bilamarchaeum dharawalense]|uniref:Uncharacterized protein n=1 Tax=Candidatus Bilamarchaeum dharawalense TaxID=2885759 RepID=A0A5E4LSW7_9ARCH|nr:Uncharacterised protein [Candidatus Bilamarchaeum dharawalense]